MSEFPDLIATVRTTLLDFSADAIARNPQGVTFRMREDALAALDVLAGGVWLTREEAERVQFALMGGFSFGHQYSDLAHLLAARLSEVKA